MSLQMITSGESHGPAIVGVLEGFPAGVPISLDRIDAELARRQRGYGAGPRMKIEADKAVILGGVMAGRSTGAPITVVIENKDHAKWQGRPIEPMNIPRPGHADLTGAVKYGYTDLRPTLERASARETAARVAVGAICRQFLDHFSIVIGGYVVEIGGIAADLENIPLLARAAQAEASDVRCPDPKTAEKIREKIEEIIHARDTLGGVIEVVISGLPPGLGSHSHWARKMEARLGAALLSVQAIKGVEFGMAFANARKRGTQVHDAIMLDGDELSRPTNHAAGIEGGITNGEPILVRAAMKPIATTLKPQQTVDLASGKQVPTEYHRSDFCPVPRAVPILEGAAAFAIADALIEKLGGDSLTEMIPRYETLRQMRLSDFHLDDEAQMWWPE